MARTEPTEVSTTNLAGLAANAPAWPVVSLQRLRRAALERFEQLGIPGKREEEWRQTNVTPLGRTSFERAADGVPSEAELAALPLADLDVPRIVLVNGRWAPALSRLDGLPSGVRVERLHEAMSSSAEAIEPLLGRLAPFDSHAFTALNTAAFEDGAVVRFDAGVVARTPIHVVHVTTPSEGPTVSHPRLLIVAGPRAEGAVIESYHGTDGSAYLTNAVTELSVAESAMLDHVRVQWEGADAWHVGAVHVLQARDSRYVNHNVSFGARLARHDIRSVLDGEGAEATLDGLYVAVDSQHVDNHTVLDHARPHCPSHELYKGILAGRAQAVFNGRIIVRPDAQKTDAKQSNKSMLLTNDAFFNDTATTEIYTDDVRCTHGATIGHLEDDALFYLRARGIGVAEARAILIHGFLGDILERIPHAAVRERLEAEAVAIVSRELASGGHS
jgi:Fe-S cluster assembly protein SufD